MGPWSCPTAACFRCAVYDIQTEGTYEKPRHILLTISSSNPLRPTKRSLRGFFEEPKFINRKYRCLCQQRFSGDCLLPFHHYLQDP